MPVQKFTLYDLIVDIVPGFGLLIAVMPILSMESIQKFPTSSITATAAALVLLSYPVGRILIHGASSPMERVFERIFMSISNLIYDENAEELSLEGWFRSPEESPESVSETVVVSVRRSIETRINTQDMTEPVIRYGEGILYNKQSIYGKYEILSSFYRHFSLVFLALFIIYFSSMTFGRLIDLQPGYPMVFELPMISQVIILFSFYSLFLASVMKWAKWKKKSNRAFINDLHVYFNEELGVSPGPQQSSVQGNQRIQ
jgi:hypothetical protein